MQPVRIWQSKLRDEELTKPVFDEKSAEKVFKAARLPKGWDSGRPDYKEIAEMLNAASVTYRMIDDKRKNAPNPKKIMDELCLLHEHANELYEIMRGLSLSARSSLTHLFEDLEFFDNLQDRILGLSLKSAEAVKGIETQKGAPKTIISTFILKLEKIYQDTTGRKPGVGVSQHSGTRSGPFLLFVKSVFEQVDPTIKPTNRTVASWINKAKIVTQALPQ